MPARRTLVPAALLLAALLVAPGMARCAEYVVAASIPPLAWFIQGVGGPGVQVEVLVEPGASPHAYEPSPRQMRAVARARAFFGVGVEFERVWLPRLRDLNPDMVVQHTDHGLDTIPMQAHGHGHGHDEDHGGDHAEGRPDPHVWLSPDNARHIARAVRDGLARVDPGNAATYQANLERVLGEIGELDATLTQWLAPVRGEGFLVFHPTWGYLAREYGLEQLAIQAQGREPGPRQLAAVIETARERGIRTVFVQPQFSAATARVVAKALDGEVVTADPLAADWKDNLLHVGRALRNALETR